MPFATTWMDLEGIMLSEISQLGKDKYHVMSIICGILETKQAKEKRNKQTNKQIRLLNTENKLMVTRGEVSGGWVK